MARKKKNTNLVDKNKSIITTLLIFLFYFIYNDVAYSVFSVFNVTNNIFISFIADIMFFSIIVFMYRNNLKEDFINLTKKYNFSKIIKTILGWLLVILVFNMFMGIVTEFLLPNANYDENTMKVRGLFTLSPIYAIFKTMIFAVVAEELLFRESISNVVKNDWIFIIVSSAIYALMNFLYVGFDSQTIVMDILSYFLPALIFSYAYVRNNRNIFIVMFIKLLYSFIPLLGLFMGI